MHPYVQICSQATQRRHFLGWRLPKVPIYKLFLTHLHKVHYWLSIINSHGLADKPIERIPFRNVQQSTKQFKIISEMNQQPVQNAAPQQEQATGGGFSIWNMIIMYFVMSQIFSFFSKPSTRSSYMNMIENGEPFILTVSINTSEPIEWREEGLYYDTSSENFRTHTFNVRADELLANPNVSAFVTIRVPSKDLDLNTSFNLCSYLKKKVNKTKNLMFDANEEYMIKRKEDETTNQTKVLHIKTIDYINLIHDVQPYSNQIPPQFIGKYRFSNMSSEGPKYTPYVDVESYRLRRKDQLIVEDEEVAPDTEFNITMEFQTQAYWKFLITQSLQDSGKVYEQFGMADLMSDEVTQDQMKEMIFETNVYLVVVTFLVSLLHTVFSTLAIKNDFQYWKNLENHQGISVRMLYQNFILEIIITLYLFDNETSYLILVQSVIELGMMVWKILKTTKFKWREDGKFPYVQMDHNQSYKSTTQEFDKAAMKYLYMLLLPLFVGYLVYSLIYEEHKGWYSYFLTSCVGFIYVFGFINMTPQLYINYKLKSVAHLPWRMMIYKFLNTIVDDLFAFIITMPWLKRLSCFRDDIIFLIYIYQRRIYRVDLSRRVLSMIYCVQDNGGSFDQPMAAQETQVPPPPDELQQQPQQPTNEPAHAKQD